MKNITIIIISICMLFYLLKINNYLSSHFIDPLDYQQVQKFNAEYNSHLNPDLKKSFSHILLVIIDGARRDYLYSENISPKIVSLWNKNGLRFNHAYSMAPSISAANYFSIVSGAAPFLHGVINNNQRFPADQKVRTLFHSFSENGISSCVIGFNWYKDMFKGVTNYIPAECCERDDSAEVARTVTEMIRLNNLPFFTLVHFLAPDNMAHRTGSSSSNEYIESIKTIDGLIDDIYKNLIKSFPESLVIITSDHGMNIDGNHGGTDDNTIRIPLYFISPSIPRGSTDRDVYNISIAPTIAALSRIPIPSFSCGSMIYDILNNELRPGYLSESIDKKEYLLKSLGGTGVKSLALTANHIESLGQRDIELTKEILDHNDKIKDRIIFIQRIIFSAFFLIFLSWIIFKTKIGTLPIIAINTAFIAIPGIIMNFIISAHQYTIAEAIYLVLCFSIVPVLYKYILDPELLISGHPIDYILYLLAVLLVEAVILAGFFLPFYTFVPEFNLFSFRFFSLSLLSPFIISFLIYFFIMLGKKLQNNNKEN